MASISYRGATDAAAGTDGLDWSAGDIQIMLLVGTTTTPEDRSKINVSQIAADEFSGGPYARQTLATKTVTWDGGSFRTELSMANIDFGAITGDTVTAAVIFLNTGSDATSLLYSYHDIPDTAVDGSGFILQVGAEGAVHLNAVSN